ncbi:L,D-transpeptidase family protein [Streptomyces sp. NPDC001840]
MLRTSALRAGCAAVAVLAVSTGCTVPAAGGPAGDAKPGGGALGAPTASASEPAEPSPSESAEPSVRPAADRTTPPAPEPTPSESTATPTPSEEPSEPTEPSKPAEPKPEPLMATGDESGQVRELQARLRQIGHFDRNPTGYYGSVTAAAVSSFQGKRGLPRTGETDLLTWQKLLDRTDEPTRDELFPPTTRPVAAPDPRCLKGRVMCISKNSRTLAWMVDGKVRSAMDVRFGSEYTPTREGTFSVGWKSRDHVSTIYDTPMPYAMFFSGGQAVHYSADFAAKGYEGASHGCVNVRDRTKIAALFNEVRTGDKVVIYW